ncbi:MAG: processed acidic surface protein, partial [Planococcus donghaensis]
MKRLVGFLVVFGFVLSTLPLSVFAIKSDEAEFNAFLVEINWEKQDYLDYLASKDWSLDEFETIDELGTPLTEKGIQLLTEKLEMTRTELNELLYEYGDLEYGEDVLDGVYLIFIEDVEYFSEFYLDDYTGTPIDDENLQELMDNFGFASEQELEEFLQGYSDSLENYDFIEDLEESLLFYTEMDDYELDFNGLFTELGLTEEEVERLIAHLETLNYEDPAFEEQLTQLSDRMMAMEDFETADELTAEQIAEMMDIYSDMINLFELKTTYFFVKDGVKKPVSLATLMTLQSTEGADLLIEIYNLKDVFLADVLLTADMFGSDLIADTGKDLGAVETIISTPAVTQKPTVSTPSATKTVKGGKLPVTASNFVPTLLFGLALLLSGVILFRRL